MKHGQKAKGKTAKAKASGKKSSSKSRTKSKASKKSSAATGKKSSPKAGPENGKGRGRISTEAVSFSNPVVAAAFRRAVKKYPTAFRRLTD